MEVERITASVAVLGGGPAGSIAAALLARRGVDVVVLEKERFPRDKVCGEFLSWDALPVLEAAGISLDGVGAPRITRSRIVTARGDAEFALPAPALGISRFAFDEILLRNAAAAGAHVLEGTPVTAIARHDGGFRIAARDAQQQEITIEARAVVGAWGRWGRLDLDLERRFTGDRRHRYIGFKRHYAAGLTASDVIELHSFERGYLGAQAIEGSRSNLCGLVHQDEIAGLRGGWPEFVESLRTRHRPLARLLEVAEPAQEEFLSSEPVIFRPKSPVDGGIFLVGDAAGLIDPLTGNGMAMAVQSGALAVSMVIASLAGDRQNGLRAYARAHRDLFSQRLFWSRRCADVLRRPALLQTSVLLGRRTGLGAWLARATRASPRRVDALVATLT